SEKVLLEAASEGFAKSYFNLGLLNKELGNDEISEKMYEKGVELNDEDAIYNMAILEMNRKNYTRSIELYKKLTKKKHINACINLGILYEISGNDEEAEKAYIIAADEGNELAQYRLGYL